MSTASTVVYPSRDERHTARHAVVFTVCRSRTFSEQRLLPVYPRHDGRAGDVRPIVKENS